MSGIIVIVLIIIGSIVGPVVAVVVAASAVGADINNAFNNALNNAGITFPTAITFPSTTPLNCFDEFGTHIWTNCSETLYLINNHDFGCADMLLSS